MVQVSVPYRGLIFLNNVWRTKRKLHLWFPSPTGDLYFSMLIKFQLFRVKRFRPLPGTYISQSDRHTEIVNYVTMGFRPLPGTYISQFLYNDVSSPSITGNAVSVPYRGLIFLNTISAIPCKH